jgi:hypothetical protein
MDTDHFESLPKCNPALHDTGCDPSARTRHRAPEAEAHEHTERHATHRSLDTLFDPDALLSHMQ